ncbi:His Kinase A (phospho-acceptor) domain-containing protein [Belliella buryatensis]|uniref:histidine kinase n=1 Tax=Belliella buryatensis TaxID=1500549 RepID=A0A239GNA3_9BACT|nr:ATP-binding protein [Belliella buryatensis]SNS70355.1 His Kinase A (phospho-acceptor) domain-containing protein [Belliella buryatensis]
MKPSFKIALIYLLVGVLWILLSDRILELILEPLDIFEYKYYQSIKGVTYVTLTAILLYILVKKYHINLSNKINELEKLNEELNSQSKKLENSNRELEQIVFVASHDLQEPLRMISSFMTQLERKYISEVNDKGKKYIRFAIDGAERMKRIILDLLDFSEATKINEDDVELNMNQLMEKLVASHQKTIFEKEAKVTWDPMPSIIGKRVQLIQVFQNLLRNALSYHKEETSPEIHITFKEDKREYLFAIKDNGIGIKPRYQERIFNIFQRLHTHDEVAGTGMGLAISKKLVSNMGGKIWVESEEGKGSTFYFTIPKNQL